jgi:hypothetical protein
LLAGTSLSVRARFFGESEGVAAGGLWAVLAVWAAAVPREGLMGSRGKSILLKVLGLAGEVVVVVVFFPKTKVY